MSTKDGGNLDASLSDYFEKSTQQLDNEEAGGKNKVKMLIALSALGVLGAGGYYLFRKQQKKQEVIEEANPNAAPVTLFDSSAGPQITVPSPYLTNNLTTGKVLFGYEVKSCGLGSGISTRVKGGWSYSLGFYPNEGVTIPDNAITAADGPICDTIGAYGYTTSSLTALCPVNNYPPVPAVMRGGIPNVFMGHMALASGSDGTVPIASIPLVFTVQGQTTSKIVLGCGGGCSDWTALEPVSSQSALAAPNILAVSSSALSGDPATRALELRIPRLGNLVADKTNAVKLKSGPYTIEKLLSLYGVPERHRHSDFIQWLYAVNRYGPANSALKGSKAWVNRYPGGYKPGGIVLQKGDLVYIPQDFPAGYDKPQLPSGF